jgi:hypothetical protein
MATRSINPTARVVIKRGPLSCITRQETTRGAWLSDNCFDVPAEDYGEGNLTGCRIAAEFMRAAAEGKKGFDPLDVIKDACKALDERDKSGRRGAAVGFMRTLEELLVGLAPAVMRTGYIENQIEQSLKWRRETAERKAAEGLDFARRMEIAKAAKAHALASIARIAKEARQAP